MMVIKQLIPQEPVQREKLLCAGLFNILAIKLSPYNGVKLVS